jgi:hypothetical protein
MAFRIIHVPNITAFFCFPHFGGGDAKYNPYFRASVGRGVEKDELEKLFAQA